MNLSNTTPKISSIAIILIILFILNMAGGYLITPYLTSIFYEEEYHQYDISVGVASFVKFALGALLNIVLAIWTFSEAKKQNETPIIWAAFALFFGLIAIVLFYLFILIKELKTLNQKMDKEDK